jgi:hypothetical protein
MHPGSRSVRVFSTTCHSASITSVLSKWRPFIVIFNGEPENSKVDEFDSDVPGKKFPGGKGIVRRCVVVMQQPVLLSPKFGAKSSHIFTQSP